MKIYEKYLKEGALMGQYDAFQSDLDYIKSQFDGLNNLYINNKKNSVKREIDNIIKQLKTLKTNM